MSSEVCGLVITLPELSLLISVFVFVVYKFYWLQLICASQSTSCGVSLSVITETPGCEQRVHKLGRVARDATTSRLVEGDT